MEELPMSSAAVVSPKVKVEGFRTGSVGEELALPCHFIAHDSNLTVVQVTWLKKVGTVNTNLAVYNPQFGTSYPAQSGRITFNDANSQNCTLTISPLQLDDEGIYSCEVNAFPTGKQESETNLTVLAKPVNEVVAVTTDAGLSEAAVANCTAANGKPAADVTWIVKVPGNIMSTQIDNPDGTVTIVSQYRIVPTRADHGENVTCLVSHKALAELVNLPVTLSVRYPPEVTITGYDGSWYINRGTVSLRCLAKANPAATSYRWTMNSGPLPETVQVEGDHLLITQVDSSLNGTWTCEATNSVGKGNGEITVVVRERDLPSVGESFASTTLYVVIGMVAGVTAIAVLLTVAIARKRRRIPDTKSEASPSPQTENKIIVFATLNLNMSDAANPPRRQNCEPDATIHADININ
uniref:nectin-1-like isoform X2 n=1 Tax=Pristiophorus japonicus TaxID=55135 RepID=UPI00398F2D53